jgi:uncharacterized protein (DUF4415 family)
MSGKDSDLKTTWVDPDDAPELTEEWFAKADFHDGKLLIRHNGRRMEAVTIGLDPEVLAHFRAASPDWQSRLNDLLRKSIGLPE